MDFDFSWPSNSSTYREHQHQYQHQALFDNHDRSTRQQAYTYGGGGANDAAAAHVAAIPPSILNNNNNINALYNNEDENEKQQQLTTTTATTYTNLTATAATTANNTNANTNTKITEINGIGLWNSWTRNFTSPLLAIWDLLDNSIDAACPNHGKVHIEPDYYDGIEQLSAAPTSASAAATFGIRIQNTCLNEVAPLSKILKAYESSKVRRSEDETTTSTCPDDNATFPDYVPPPLPDEEDADPNASLIGENGVGVKQGCATLSDLSFIMTRNVDELALGILAKELQKTSGIYLPSYTWKSNASAFFDSYNNNNDTDDRTIVNILKEEIYRETRLLLDGGDLPLQRVVAEYGGRWQKPPKKAGSITQQHIDEDNDNPTPEQIDQGVHRLAYHFMRLSDRYGDGQWGQSNHVFCLVLHKLKHNSSRNKGTHTTHGAAVVAATAAARAHVAVKQEHPVVVRQDRPAVPNNRANIKMLRFLKEIETELPKHYLHVLHSFDLQVDRVPVRFNYWQSRLVELTKCDVVIDTEVAVKQSETTSAFNYKLFPRKYMVRVYLGFDPIRTADRKQSSSARLIWHSRKAGRLIKQHVDGRPELGLNSTGTDYSQGLTIIVDDVEGRLPLDPTKQDFAFGEQPIYGEIHRSNLKLWISAIAAGYWNHHLDKCAGRSKKSLLTERVEKLKPRVKENLLSSQNQEEAAAAINIKSIDECDLKRFTDCKWIYSERNGKKKLTLARFNVENGSDTTMEFPELTAVKQEETASPPPPPPPPNGPDLASSSQISNPDECAPVVLPASSSSTAPDRAVSNNSFPETVNNNNNNNNGSNSNRKRRREEKPGPSSTTAELEQLHDELERTKKHVHALESQVQKSEGDLTKSRARNQQLLARLDKQVSSEVNRKLQEAKTFHELELKEANEKANKMERDLKEANEKSNKMEIRANHYLMEARQVIRKGKSDIESLKAKLARMEIRANHYVTEAQKVIRELKAKLAQTEQERDLYKNGC